MAGKPWDDKALLRNAYVTRRLSITQIAEEMKKKYGLSVTAQTIYNRLRDFDLLKLNGKGNKRAKFYGQSAPTKKVSRRI